MMKRIMLLLAAGIMSVAITACGKEEGNAPASVKKTESVSESIPESLPEETKEETNTYQVGNVDNFSVNSKVVSAFGKEVKEIVAAQDLEALADLTAFPVYIGFADGGVSVETREDFIALGEDRIFTQEFVEAMSQAKEDDLPASRAGFSLTDDGVPNVIFGVRDGKLAIQGINY